MHPVLQKYLDGNFTYVFTQGPDRARTFELAQAGGINCISLSHLVLRDMYGVMLPESYKSSELFNDTQYFKNVDNLESMQLGDLVWFGLPDPKVTIEAFSPDYKNGELLNWRDFPVKHAAIYTGNNTNDYQMLHATSKAGTVVVWPLQQFNEYEKYQRIYGIKRLKTY